MDTDTDTEYTDTFDESITSTSTDPSVLIPGTAREEQFYFASASWSLEHNGAISSSFQAHQDPSNQYNTSSSFEESLLSGDDGEELELAKTKFIKVKLKQLQPPIISFKPKSFWRANIAESKQNDFVMRKIEVLKNKNTSSSVVNEIMCCVTHKQRTLCDEKIQSGVPKALVERLKIENLMQRMKKACDDDFHVPSQCQACRTKKQEMAEKEFVKLQSVKVSKKLVEEKLDRQLYTKDSLTYIGDIMKDAPKLSDDPTQIWTCLNNRGRPSK